MLVDELQGDETAPLLLLRLWAHCQVKKTHRLGRVSAGAMKSICRYKGAQEQLWLALQNSGFIEVKNECVTIHQWEAYNGGLITSWMNGRKGGRPTKPAGIPQVSRREPGPNPLETDKIGLDRIGEENTVAPAKPPRARDLLFEALAEIQGADLAHLTNSERGKLNKMLKEIKTAQPSATPDELRAKAREYRRIHPTWECTAPAIVGHWSELRIGANGSEKEKPESAPEPHEWMKWLRANRPDSPLIQERSWAAIDRASQDYIISSMAATS